MDMREPAWESARQQLITLLREQAVHWSGHRGAWDGNGCRCRYVPDHAPQLRALPN